MSQEAIQNFFLKQSEPLQSCMYVMRDIILAIDEDVSEHWSYGVPMYKFRGKLFCYIWKDKKTQHPYLGVYHGKLLNHPNLMSEGRKKVAILRINPDEDIPADLIQEILSKAKQFY